jgi:hypothetical protein
MSDLRADGSLKSNTCTRMGLEDTLKPVEPTMQATDVDVEKGPVDVGSEQSCAAGDVYDRFSPRRKNVIVCIVSFSAFLSRECVTFPPPRIPPLIKPLQPSPLLRSSHPSRKSHTTPPPTRLSLATPLPSSSWLWVPPLSYGRH